MSNTTTFYLVRHGETLWNTQERWQGQSDSALTLRGIQQVADLAERLHGTHFDTCYSSDLPRAVASAKILAKKLNIEIHTSVLLRERNAGPVEGTTQLERQTQPQLHRTFENYLGLNSSEKWGTKPFPDFESNQEVAIRLETELLHLVQMYSGQTILIVVHGGNIRNFLAHIGALSKDQVNQWRLSNAGLAVVAYQGNRFSATHLDQLVPRPVGEGKTGG